MIHWFFQLSRHAYSGHLCTVVGRIVVFENFFVRPLTIGTREPTYLLYGPPSSMITEDETLNGHQPQRNGNDKKHSPSDSEIRRAVPKVFDGLVLYRSLAVTSPSYNAVDSDIEPLNSGQRALMSPSPKESLWTYCSAWRAKEDAVSLIRANWPGRYTWRPF